jgi:agmatine deiminase
MPTSEKKLQAAQGFRMPAEWEPHAGTWLTWPASRDWPGKLEAVRCAYCSVVRALQAFEEVHLIVQDPNVRANAKAMLEAAGVDERRVHYFTCQTNRTWARDNLPIFVRNREGEIAAVKWRFNGWARYKDHGLDDEAGRRVAKTARAAFEPSVQIDGKKSRVVLEGGSIDVDGAGTLLTTRRCLLGAPRQRNPGLDQTDVERLLSTYLGVEKVLWLEDGIAGDDTSGHVDDFARFVSPGRVVVASEPNTKDENHAPLRDARLTLASMRDARGKKLEVIELPMPEPVFYRGERLPASYANFYIANEQVLVPTFDDAADYRALGILSELFPGRRIVGIHCRDLVVGLGTLHCSTQQLPAGGKTSRHRS